MDNAYQPSETLEAITKLIPETFYADRPIEERIKFLVDGWQKAIKGLTELETRVDKALAEDNRVKELEHSVDSLCNLIANANDTLRSRGVDASVGPLDIRVIELAKQSDNARAERDKWEADAKRFAENSDYWRGECDKAKADLAHYKESLAAGKRPFSDAFSAQTIEGQIKTIMRQEKRCAELSAELANLRDDLSQNGGVEALLGATIEAQRDRIKELEGPANKYIEIEMLLSRRKALDGFAAPIEKVAAMLHICRTADPSGELTQQHAGHAQET